MTAAAPVLKMGILPWLREELSLHTGPAEHTGAPTWTIRDPVRNRFFRIGWPAFEILSRWHLGSAEAVAASVNGTTTLGIDADDVNAVAQFLKANQLTRPTGHGDTQCLIGQAAAGRRSWANAALHNYLFFRIPLVRPDRFLDATAPFVAWIGSRWFFMATLAAMVAGVFLILRQWDLFAATLLDTLTIEGMVSYGIALAVVKVAHELAHAYATKRFGRRVPTMGVALLVLWPVLYTDVNEAWLLSSRRQRLLVGAAGILLELAIAAWASLAWSFLPEGPLKQVAFVLAATTWVSSLAINLPPFLRFDGYFLAVDALEMPNLHPRCFAMGRWWLREALFGLGEKPPEAANRLTRGALTAFAVVVWAYRLLLFLGIAVLVYHFFIKAVGVVLFAVEILWFIVLPIWREAEEWWKRRQAIKSAKRLRLTAALLSALLLLAVVPWQSRITAPAVAKAADIASIFLPAPAQLTAIHARQGDSVAAGQTLFTFVSPDAGFRGTQISARLHGKILDLEGAQLDPFLREHIGVLREDVAKARAELSALDAEAMRLTITAPFDGQFSDPMPDLTPGQFLSPAQQLGLVHGGKRPVAIAYVVEDDLHRIAPGGEVTFVPRSLGFPVGSGTIERIDSAPIKTLADAMLASIHGGSIPSRVSDRSIIPERAYTRVTIRLNSALPKMELEGIVLISGERSSLLARLARSILMVIIREWGT